MKRIAIASGVLLLCSTVFAQDYVTSPKNFLYKEGNSTATFSLGDYAFGRFQYGDGHHRGMPMTIKGTSYRLANYVYKEAHGMGRSFSNVKLRVSQCSVKTFSNYFTKNQLTTPVTVFDKAVTWPTVPLGKPGKSPADWTLTFPFSTNWVYNGSNDICLDYTFTGGKLANNGTWSGTTGKAYYKDGQNYPTYITRPSAQLGYSGNNLGCNDRARPDLYGAHIWSDLTAYSEDHSTAWGGKIRFRQWGNWFPNSHQLLTVVGFKAVRNGWDLPGTTCNKIYIDFGLPVFFIPSFSGSTGSLNALELAVDNPGVGGVEFVSQIGWADSRNRDLLVSDAAVLFAPFEPPAQPTNLLYYWNTTNTTGYVNASRSYQPVVRYTK